MSTYATLHVGLVALFLALAAVHAGLAWFARGDRLNAWVAVALLGFAMVAAGAGASSSATNGALGPPGAWSLLAALAGVPMVAAVPRVVWSLFGVPITPRRLKLVAIAGAVNGAWVCVRIGRYWLGRPGGFWEDDMLRLGTSGCWGQVFSLAVLGVWLVGTLRAVRKRPALALVLFGVGLVPLAIMVREQLILFEVIRGPTLFGFVGAPFVVVASITSAASTLRAARDQGRYRVIEKIGAGGMGEVLLAERVGAAGFSRRVVLKRIHSDGEGRDREQRFLQEARLVASLKHPNIVDVYDLERREGHWYLAMEFLDGVNLAQAKARYGPTLPPQLIAEVGEKVARALAHAHANGVVHRDVSPSNIMLTHDGVVKLIDFGVAKRADGAPTVAPSKDSPLTAGGAVVGKLGYLAPEQLEGGPATAVSDQFALGVSLWELACGYRPFIAKTELELVQRMTSSSAPKVEEHRPGLPEPLASAIDRALERSPERRFESCAELGRACAEVLRLLPPIDLAQWVKESFAKPSPPASSAPATGTTAPGRGRGAT